MTQTRPQLVSNKTANLRRVRVAAVLVVACFLSIAPPSYKSQFLPPPSSSSFELPPAGFDNIAQPPPTHAETAPPTSTSAQQQQPLHQKRLNFDIEKCLDCLCLASSLCQIDKQPCNSTSHEGCGQYKLSFTYWADAGALTPASNSSRFDDENDFLSSSSISLLANPRDFEQCALDSQCSRKSIKEYFLKYARDCNNDDKIDCQDMAAIHRAGSAACSAQWLQDTDFWHNFSLSGCLPGQPVQRIFAPNRNQNSAVTPSSSLTTNGRSNNRLNQPLTSRNSFAVPSGDSFAEINFPNNNRIVTNGLGFSRTVRSSNTPAAPPSLDNVCMHCLCEAQSGCDLSNKNCESNEVCGPFAITSGYWLDAGSPGSSWLSCAKSRACSEQAVKNYMTLYATDCDSDGRVSCADLVAIHQFGASSCSTAKDLKVRALNPVFARFDSCWANKRRLQPALNASRPPSPVLVPTPATPRPVVVVRPVQPTIVIDVPVPNSNSNTGSSTDDFPQPPPRPRPQQPSISQPPQSRPTTQRPPLVGNDNDNDNDDDDGFELPRIPSTLRPFFNTPPPSFRPRSPPSTPSLPLAPEVPDVPQPPFNNFNSFISSSNPNPNSGNFELPPVQPIDSSDVPQPSRNESYFNTPMPAAGFSSSSSSLNTNTGDGISQEVPRPPSSSNSNDGFDSPSSSSSSSAFTVRSARDTPTEIPPNKNSSLATTGECFECLCEAATNCDLNSRCQSRDVRKTRCGMFLISFDQWIESGLASSLVSNESLLVDPAASERAFYACATDKTCANSLLSTLYANLTSDDKTNNKLIDCNKDGKIDCYDFVAYQQSGNFVTCSSDLFLESQFWTDFNTCYGF